MSLPLFEASVNSCTHGFWTQLFCTHLLALLPTSVRNWVGQFWFRRSSSDLLCPFSIYVLWSPGWRTKHYIWMVDWHLTCKNDLWFTRGWLVKHFFVTNEQSTSQIQVIFASMRKARCKHILFVNILMHSKWAVYVPSILDICKQVAGSLQLLRTMQFSKKNLVHYLLLRTCELLFSLGCKWILQYLQFTWTLLKFFHAILSINCK